MMTKSTMRLPRTFLSVAIIMLTFQVAAVYLAAATDDYTFNEELILESDQQQARSITARSSNYVPISRLRIPMIQVDAPVVLEGLNEQGIMVEPSGAWEVAWYDFSALPGSPGNAVFSGHVDHVDVGPAVFWDLRRLARNAVVEIVLSDGTLMRYTVVAKASVDVAEAPIDAIVGPTVTESITLITCAGTYDQATDGYDKRLVVRAERIY